LFVCLFDAIGGINATYSDNGGYWISSSSSLRLGCADVPIRTTATSSAFILFIDTSTAIQFN